MIKRERCQYCKAVEEYGILRLKRRELNGATIWACEPCLWTTERYIP